MTELHPPPTTYESLANSHECSVVPASKSAMFAIMEDGKVCLVIANNSRSAEGKWGILEYLPMDRADFNKWLHMTRQWWNEEKARPTPLVGEGS